MPEYQRKLVLGVPVDCINWRSGLDLAEELLDSGRFGQAVLAVNPEKVIAARKDPQLLAQLERACLLLPDGIGVVIAARMAGARCMERVPGSEFLPALCGLAQRKGLSVFLFGGTERVNERAAATLQTQFPGLVLAGRRNGYVEPANMDDLVRSINDSGASILFLALGSPKQELWIAEFGPRLTVRICQGVGGTFDVIAGEVKRAPSLFRRFHLEWFYRLVTNPARAKRQASLPKFAWLFLTEQLLGRGRRKLH